MLNWGYKGFLKREGGSVVGWQKGSKRVSGDDFAEGKMGSWRHNCCGRLRKMRLIRL
ncbi:hypothetical protein Hanom_Chr02g00134491 [Helianthus anomalus]